MGSILILVPHDPELDPRVLWTIDLCASIMPTHVLALTTSAGNAGVQVRGAATVERIAIDEPDTSPAQAGSSAAPRPSWRARLPVPAWARARREAIHHFTTTLGYYSRFGGALWRRASALETRPSLILCHDIYALGAALRLKRLWGCKVIYDSHEYWPEADLMAERWEMFLTRVYERRRIREADAVVTVSPPLAELLERTYGLRDVISVPNACPLVPGIRTSAEREQTLPVRFLVQGQASARRGFEELIEAWRLLDDDRAVLEFRCPPNPYLDALQAGSADLEKAGRLRFLPPVAEDQLVAAATESDVGLIPYPAHSLNHVYACPNKLAQYMHGGLAVLSNDLAYVRSVLEEYGCGLVFDVERPASLAGAVRDLLANPARLQAMKEASARAAKTFNWQVQSAPYRVAVMKLSGVAPAQLTV